MKKGIVSLLFLFMLFGISACLKESEQGENLKGMERIISNEDLIEVYYQTDWVESYIHYNADNSSWTSVPGELMEGSSLFTGYKYALIEANSVVFALTDGNNNWDNNGGNNYQISEKGVYTLINGKVKKGEPIIKIYYSSNWSETYIHYNANNTSWTNVPGDLMSKSENYEGYSYIEIYGSELEFVFNDNLGNWNKNNNDQNYYIETPGIYTLKNGVISEGEPKKDLIKLYYKTNWEPANIHYNADGKGWTELPGKVMDIYEGNREYKCTEIEASELEFVISNNGQGHFDNNEQVINNAPIALNYHIYSAGVYKLEDGLISEGLPESKISQIRLETDKSEIKAYNIDYVNFKSFIKYNDGTEIESNNSEYYCNGEKLESNTFKTNKGGVYNFTAKLGGSESNEIIVTAISMLPKTIWAEEISENSVRIEWEEVEADGYKLYRSKETESNYIEIADLETFSFNDEGLNENINYYYKIKVYKGNGESCFSEALKVKTTNEIVYAENSKIFDNEEEFMDLESIEEDKIIFNKIKDFEIGDIISISFNEKAPDGILRKVTKVYEESGKTVVETEQAQLEDFIIQGTLYLDTTIEEEITVRSSSRVAGSLNKNTDFKIQKGNSKIYLKGPVNAKMKLTFTSQVDQSIFTLKGKLKNGSYIKIWYDYELGAEFKGELNLGKYSFDTPFKLQVNLGAVPVTIEGKGFVELGASSSETISKKVNGKIGMGVTYGKKGWIAEDLSNKPRVEPDFGDQNNVNNFFETSGLECSAKASLGMEIQSKFYESISGPYVGLDAATTLNCNLNTVNTGKWDTGVYLSGGIRTGLFGITLGEWKKQVPLWKKDLFEIDFQPKDVKAIYIEEDMKIEITWQEPIANILGIQRRLKDYIRNFSGYKLYRTEKKDAVHSEYKEIANVEFTASTQNTYIDTQIEPGLGKKYYYKIRFYENSSNDGELEYLKGMYSVPIEVKVEGLEAPVVELENSGMGTKLTWNEIEGAVGYKIYKIADSNAGFMSKFEELAETASGTWIDSELAENDIYYYYVKAYNSEREGEKSNIVYKSTLASLELNFDEGNVRLNWSSPQEGKSFIYAIYKKSTITNIYERQEKTFELTWDDRGELLRGETYYYFIKIIGKIELDNGKVVESEKSNEIEFMFIDLEAPILAINEINENESFVELSSNIVAGATGYKVYRSKSENVNFSEIDTENSYRNRFKDKNLEAGIYWYKIKARAENARGEIIESEFSNMVQVEINILSAPSNLKCESTENTIKLLWDWNESLANGSEFYYELEYSFDGVNYYNLATLDEKEYLHENLDFETEYYYRLSIFTIGRPMKISNYTTTMAKTLREDGGIIQGTVKDAVTGGGIKGAEVKIISQYWEEVIYTDDLGMYRSKIPVLPEGQEYTIYISKKNYITAIVNGITVAEGEVQNIEAILYVEEGNPGSIAGEIRDALTGSTLDQVTLKLRFGINTKIGDVVKLLSTDSNGFYEIENLEPGNYTIELSKMGYINSYFTATCLPDILNKNQNGTIIPSVSSGIRIVLSWGESPEDLDSHLTGPKTKVFNGSNGRFHVYYNEKEYNAIPWPMEIPVNNPPYDKITNFVNLDVDDTSSYGPETITFYPGKYIPGCTSTPDVFRYSVHNYSEKEESASTGLANSGATVKVYNNYGLQATFHVPSGSGTIWTVFEMDTAEKITPINTMANQSDPGSVRSLSAIDYYHYRTDSYLINNLFGK